MTKITQYNAFTKITAREKHLIAHFLQESLEHRLPANSIMHALDYAVKDIPSMGGCILTIEKNATIVGAAVINDTGMHGYSPKHKLICFAVQEEYRDNGVAGALFKGVLDKTRGDIALHLAPDDPARPFFEQMGFKTACLEFRLDMNAAIKWQKQH